MIALDSRAEMLLRYNLPFCDRVLQLSGKHNPTVRDFMHYTGPGAAGEPLGRQPEGYRRPFGRVVHRAGLQRLRRRPAYLSGTFEAFVRLVIPELQRRGVYRKAYAGTTLRIIGSARPEVGAWRH